MWLVLLTCLLTLTITQSANRLEIEDENLNDDDFIPFLGERNDRFDWMLCSVLDERVPGNVIASPISVKLLLSMLYESTTGETAREIEKALQITASKTVTRAQNSATLQTLQASNPHYELEIGNRIYIDKRLSSRNWYRRVLSLYYGTFIEKINFHSATSAASKINEWVKTVTHGHIKNLIGNAESLRETALVLVNAVYFQGRWKAPFPVKDSFNGNFISPDGPQPVRYMTKTGLYFISESQELDARLLRLPYKGNKFSMYILLPRQKDGLNQVLSKVSPFHLRRLTHLLEETSVEVILPAFHFDFVMNLKKVLSDMGLKSIFTRSDDFHGIVSPKGGKNPVVSDIIQKASIQVTETGTIAAAATEMELVHKVGIPEIEFNASHPFLFYIEDEHTGTVIFEGKLVNPAITADKLDAPDARIPPHPHVELPHESLHKPHETVNDRYENEDEELTELHHSFPSMWFR